MYARVVSSIFFFLILIIDRSSTGFAVQIDIHGLLSSASCCSSRWRRSDVSFASGWCKTDSARQWEVYSVAQGNSIPDHFCFQNESEENFCCGARDIFSSMSVTSKHHSGIGNHERFEFYVEFQAIEYQHEGVVKLILEHTKDKAILEARDFQQFTPLLLSACYTNARMIAHLLKAGSDITAVEYRDKNVFHLASEFDRTDCLRVSWRHFMLLNSR